MVQNKKRGKKNKAPTLIGLLNNKESRVAWPPVAAPGAEHLHICGISFPFFPPTPSLLCFILPCSVSERAGLSFGCSSCVLVSFEWFPGPTSVWLRGFDIWGEWRQWEKWSKKRCGIKRNRQYKWDGRVERVREDRRDEEMEWVCQGDV